MTAPELMTPDEAAKKYCPFLLLRAEPHEYDCYATDCMAWHTVPETKNGEALGYCSLTNHPWTALPIPTNTRGT